MLLSDHESKQLSLSQAIVRIQNKQPLVTSEHLKKNGISPGKSMGVLLKEAERIAINEQMESVDAVILKLKKSPYWP